MDEGVLGLLLLCLGLGSIVAGPVTGVLANRFGCRKVLVSATILLALVVPWLALAPSVPVPVLAVALAPFGVSVGTVDVTMNMRWFTRTGGRPR